MQNTAQAIKAGTGTALNCFIACSRIYSLSLNYVIFTRYPAAAKFRILVILQASVGN